MDQGLLDTSGLAEVTFLPDDVILAQGKTSHRVLLLKSGIVSVEIDGNEVCRISEAHSIFGEISALLNCPHTATVKADSECVLYEINDLRAYCQAHPSAAVAVAEILANRLQHMDARFGEFKSELTAVEALGKDLSFAKRLSQLVLRMDQFWGRAVFETKPRRQ